jgi:hypothetical protein
MTEEAWEDEDGADLPSFIEHVKPLEYERTEEWNIAGGHEAWKKRILADHNTGVCLREEATKLREQGREREEQLPCWRKMKSQHHCDSCSKDWCIGCNVCKRCDVKV